VLPQAGVLGAVPLRRRRQYFSDLVELSPLPREDLWKSHRGEESLPEEIVGRFSEAPCFPTEEEKHFGGDCPIH